MQGAESNSRRNVLRTPIHVSAVTEGTKLWCALEQRNDPLQQAARGYHQLHGLQRHMVACCGQVHGGRSHVHDDCIAFLQSHSAV